jgi:hypothetical protein
VLPLPLTTEARTATHTPPSSCLAAVVVTTASTAPVAATRAGRARLNKAEVHGPPTPYAVEVLRGVLKAKAPPCAPCDLRAPGPALVLGDARALSALGESSSQSPRFYLVSDGAVLAAERPGPFDIVEPFPRVSLPAAVFIHS